MNNTYRLKNSEMQIMQALWKAEKPLTVLEIADRTEKVWKDSLLIYPVLRSLQGKNFVGVKGKEKHTKADARCFIAIISREEFAAKQVLSLFGDNFDETKFEKLISYFLKGISADIDPLIK